MARDSRGRRGTGGDRHSWFLLCTCRDCACACSNRNWRACAATKIPRCASAGLAMLMIVLFSGELVGKQESDSVRITTASQVMDRITPLTVILGNGFGVGVEERPVHMENSYLEIFHKQGVLGLLWWGSMFFFLIVRYRKARRVNHEYAQPLFLSSCFVAFESLTNPFINNPIGIFIWLIALVGLDVLSRPSSPIALLGSVSWQRPDEREDNKRMKISVCMAVYNGSRYIVSR